MPLRLRRGTSTDRLGITPLEGELIYTTDTKQVYVGDGDTPGGLLFQAGESVLNDLTDVNLLPDGALVIPDKSPLAYDADNSEWRPGDELNVSVINASTITSDNVTSTGTIVVDRLSQATGNYVEINSTSQSSGLGSSVVFNIANLVGGVETAVPFNTTLGRFRFKGFDGAEYREAVQISARTTTTASPGSISGLLTIATSSNSVFSNFFFTPSGEFVAPRISSQNVNLKGNFIGSVFGDDSTEIIDGINGAVIGKIQLTGDAPSSTSSPGQIGEIRFDSDFIYVCTATDTWKRVALDSASF